MLEQLDRWRGAEVLADDLARQKIGGAAILRPVAATALGPEAVEDEAELAVAAAALEGAVTAPRRGAIVRRPAEREGVARDGEQAARLIGWRECEARARDLLRDRAIGRLRQRGGWRGEKQEGQQPITQRQSPGRCRRRGRTG